MHLQKPTLGRLLWYRRKTEARGRGKGLPGVTQHLRILNSLPCSRLRKNCKVKFPLCSVCAYTCVCAYICACVDAGGILCRPAAAAAAGPYLGPQPSGQPRQLTWDGWPPDFQAMLTHHSISCLWIDSSQAVLILVWCSPRPSKSIEDAAQLTSLRGPVKLTAISAGAQHGQAGRLALRKITLSLHQAMPQKHWDCP